MQVSEALRELESLTDQHRQVQLLIHGDLVNEEDRSALSSKTNLAFTVLTFATFEGILTRLGPNLRVPTIFSPEDGLATKLNAIGKRAGMSKDFRNSASQILLAPRNLALHGRPIEVTFDDVIIAARLFVERCE
jgi:hypothetical protein